VTTVVYDRHDGSFDQEAQSTCARLRDEAPVYDNPAGARASSGTSRERLEKGDPR